MQIGIMHTIVRAKGLDGAFQGAAEVGAEGVEVFYQRSDTLERPGHAKRLAELASAHGLAIPSLCLGFLSQRPSLIGSPEIVSAAQRLISQAISVAADVGADVLLVPCLGKNAIETEQELQRVIESLLEVAEAAEQAGVVLGIESNLNLTQQEYLLNGLGLTGAVKIYYDTANVLSRKLDVATGIRDLGREAICQIHFKDVRTCEGQPPDYHIALGEGDVDFRAVVQALRAIGYDGWIILETPPGADPLQSASANLAFVRDALRA